MIDFQYVCKEKKIEKKRMKHKKRSKMNNDCVKLKEKKGMNEACKLRLLQIDFQLNVLRRSEGLEAVEIFLCRQFSWY